MTFGTELRKVGASNDVPITSSPARTARRYNQVEPVHIVGSLASRIPVVANLGWMRHYVLFALGNWRTKRFIQAEPDQ